MSEIIDLSQEIYSGMPLFNGLTEADTLHATHEEWEGLKNSEMATPAVLKMVPGVHTGTDVSAINPWGDCPYK